MITVLQVPLLVIRMYLKVLHHIYIAEYRSTAGEVANSARGQLNRENDFFLFCPRSRLRIWSRETRSAVRSRVSLLILQTQAESGAYSRNSSGFTWRRSKCLLTLIKFSRVS